MENKKSASPTRKRTIRSFAIFAAMAILAVWIWVRAFQMPDREGMPSPFRRALEWNGKIWHALYRSDRPARGVAPPTGKKPRFNGDLGLNSPIDLASWKMEVVSDDQDPRTRKLEIGMAEIRALPRTESTTDFHCIEGWSDEMSYAGVRFSDFLRYYGLGTRSGGMIDPSRPPADTYRYVGLETPDGEYYVSIDMDSMLHPQTLLAYEMNGKALDLPNGAPLRLIIPVKYGIKSLKRIGRIFFSDRRPPDYWAEQGYDWFSGL